MISIKTDRLISGRTTNITRYCPAVPEMDRQHVVRLPRQNPKRRMNLSSLLIDKVNCVHVVFATFDASAIVTNDSGPAHFAAATLLPTIVLFGPETPKLYQPLGSSQAIYAGLACSPCVGAHNHRKTACTDNVCMRAISVEQVYRTLESTLAQRAGNPALVS